MCRWTKSWYRMAKSVIPWKTKGKSQPKPPLPISNSYIVVVNCAALLFFPAALNAASVLAFHSLSLSNLITFKYYYNLTIYFNYYIYISFSTISGQQSTIACVMWSHRVSQIEVNAFPLPFSHTPCISNLKPLLLSTYFLLPDLALINEHKHEAPKVKILEAGTGFFGGN